ncbi:hypothetical protein DPMN_129324 [Dreissena polymorpha]|uniref:Uncharacterized protein n=1 Tax=Dreissena polymorpha TaxID=45954 RepID=A0A9D4H8V1_DREPO|nr:hypothetical protein DPMN_129324 [Dreissena polymorpha]
MRSLPAVNSVPASSAVARKSSRLFCSVTDCKLSLPHSKPSDSSEVCNCNGNKQYESEHTGQRPEERFPLRT